LEKGNLIKITFSENVTFLNKAAILQLLDQIPNDTFVEIDATNTHFIHLDVIEIIENFEVSSKSGNIDVKLINLYEDKEVNPV